MGHPMWRVSRMINTDAELYKGVLEIRTARKTWISIHSDMLKRFHAAMSQRNCTQIRRLFQAGVEVRSDHPCSRGTFEQDARNQNRLKTSLYSNADAIPVRPAA